MARWDRISKRGRVSDRRGQRVSGASVGGAGMIGVLMILGFSLLSGGEVPIDQIFQQLQPAQLPQQTATPSEFDGQDEYEVFASTVLGSNNAMWQEVFAAQGSTYTEPTLVLFRGATQSACGGATAQVGPHYCPADSTIYIDETFFDELQRRFGARGGDVAEAYVIAHEVGHHVQNLLGILDRTRSVQARQPSQANDLSVQQELQADCFAGLWAHSLRDLDVFEPGEFDEAIDAAEAVGDDRIQESINGQVNPESWTHGSSEDRSKWLQVGFTTGDVNQCDTFE